MARVPDSYFYTRIIDHLTRCDKAWRLSQVFLSETQPQPSRI